MIYNIIDACMLYDCIRTVLAEQRQAEALTRSILSQMMQGQAEIKQQLTDLNTLSSQVHKIFLLNILGCRMHVLL